MDDIKLRLSLCVPGAQRLSKQECLKNPKESYNTHKMVIETIVGKGKKAKTKKEILVVKTRKSKVVRQNINICSEGYNHMINSLEPPAPKYSKVVGHKANGTPITLWSKMSIGARLKVHLDLIAEHFNALGYTFEVLDD